MESDRDGGEATQLLVARKAMNRRSLPDTDGCGSVYNTHALAGTWVKPNARGNATGTPSSQKLKMERPPWQSRVDPR